MKDKYSSFSFQVLFKQRMDSFWFLEDLHEMDPECEYECEFIEDSAILKVEGTNLPAIEIMLVLDYYRAVYNQFSDSDRISC